MTSAAADSNSYDAVPYQSLPFAQSHPFRLATIAALFGMHPAPPQRCRVLELGCAGGGNLLPMAVVLPESEFLGIDASARQIERGAAVIQALNLENIELRQADIRGLDGTLGTFDYILAHGVYSWVSDSVQDKLLEICSRNLADHGVAFISYNTFPGWRLRGMIRDLMFYRARFFSAPERQLQEGRALLDFLARCTPKENNAYGMLLADEVAAMRNKQDYYLYHEHLEEVNEPVYFHQFMERAGAKGLQYLGEAEFSMMMAGNFPPEVEAMVRQLAGTRPGAAGLPADLPAAAHEIDVIQLEQYMDFVRNRLFRQTLLVRGGVVLDRVPCPDRVTGMYLASPARPEAAVGDVRSRENVVFRRPGSTLTTTEPLLKAAMLHLAAQWPQSVRFPDLLAAARARLHPRPLVLDPAAARAEERKLAEPMLRCYATTHVDLSVGQYPFTLEIGECPRASPLARYQAAQGLSTTNLWHELVRLSDIQRRILPYLDGDHDRQALIGRLADEVRGERLAVYDQGQPVKDPARVRDVLHAVLDEQLPQLAGMGLLCGEHPGAVAAILANGGA